MEQQQQSTDTQRRRLRPYTPPTAAEVLAYFEVKDWKKARELARIRAAMSETAPTEDEQAAWDKKHACDRFE